MGGVVSDIGELGQGAIDTVSDIGVSIDQGVRDTLGPNGWTLAALMAAGYYYAPEIGAYVNATGSTVPASAVVDAGVVSSPVTTGSVIATELPAFGTTAASSAAGTALANAATPAATALPPLSPVVPALTSTIPLSAVAPVTAEGAAAGGLGSTQTGLLGSVGSALGNLSTAQQIGLGAAALGATGALGGSTPSSSTTTSSIDPDVKAAYLRNLEEARTVGAGLGARQFAEFPEYNLGMVQNYMNPYENIVVQNTLADIERARQGQISAEGARATAAGAFGGTRQAVTRSLVDEAALRNATNAAAQLRQTGFAQAQNLGLSQEALRQQYEQQKLDAARGLGVERLNIAQGALSLQPARIGESTSTPIYRNQAVSGLGGALGGAQLGKLIGGTANPEYAGYGAGIGGLLGLM
jgi:hypothetical protein